MFLRGCPVGQLCEPLAGGAVASIRPPVASSRPVPSRLVFSLFPRLVKVVCVEGDPAGRVGLYRLCEAMSGDLCQAESESAESESRVAVAGSISRCWGSAGSGSGSVSISGSGSGSGRKNNLFPLSQGKEGTEE